ncbi:MAG TPA: hypothetical protein VF763_00930 [Candidatus Limnocylindrales bacterium]
MTERALRPGGSLERRRVAFGLFDADGWSWASVKALFWFVVIILLLGYLPDRAYYFTVFPTIDLGINAWSPVNLCPASNGSDFPCPAPAGAILAWEPSPGQLALPSKRTDGAAVLAGNRLFYVGGSDGTTAKADVYATTPTADGNFAPWQPAGSLPAPRARVAAVFLGGSVYVVGGADDSGAPTDTVFVGTPGASTGAISSWKTDDTLKLPAPRAGAAVVVAGDGLFVVGGSDAKGPTTTVWKATLDTKGALGAWKPVGPLPAAEPRTDAGAALLGNYLFVYGGSGASGPTATVLRADVSTSNGATTIADGKWATSADANLPAPRTRAETFVANGTLYVVGGTDGQAPQSETYWTTPSAQGVIDVWHHLTADDLPASLGLAGAAAVPSGSHAFLIGGTTRQGVTDGTARSNLAPQPPFFQLGLVGATIPALSIQGEIGQQLGYLAAAGVGTIDFALLVLIGAALAHRERTREFLARLRRRGRTA